MYVLVATCKSRNAEIKIYQKIQRHHNAENQYERKIYNEDYRRFPYCSLFSLHNRV